MTAAAQKEGARRTDSPRPTSDSLASSSVRESGDRIKRRRMPPGPMAVRGNPGRLLARLWERAPWSQGAEAFVWPARILLEGELGISRTAFYRAEKRLIEDGWVTRTTKVVRGRAKPVKGWVLHEDQIPGDLFRGAMRPDDVARAEVLIDTYGEDGHGTTESRKAGRPSPEKRDDPSSIGTEVEPNLSFARAREGAPTREPGEDEEDSAAPIPPKNPPRPPPPDTPRPAAETLEIWTAHERQRSTELSDVQRLHPRAGELAEVERLVEYVQLREGSSVEAARARVTRFARALVANAVKATRERSAWSTAFRARCTVGTWSPELYERVVARGDVERETDPVAAWRAREYVADGDPYAAQRRPLYLPEPEPAPLTDGSTSEELAAEVDAFLASIRRQDAP